MYTKSLIVGPEVLVTDTVSTTFSVITVTVNCCCNTLNIQTTWCTKITGWKRTRRILVFWCLICTSLKCKSVPYFKRNVSIWIFFNTFYYKLLRLDSRPEGMVTNIGGIITHNIQMSIYLPIGTLKDHQINQDSGKIWIFITIGSPLPS